MKSALTAALSGAPQPAAEKSRSAAHADTSAFPCLAHAKEGGQKQDDIPEVLEVLDPSPVVIVGSATTNVGANGIALVSSW